MRVKLLSLLYQGATIVDQIVSISPVENYVANREMQVSVTNTSISYIICAHIDASYLCRKQGQGNIL